MPVVVGSSIGFLGCPHCGKETEFSIRGNKAHIICSDHNCWGGMSVQWGTHNEPYRFIEKMKASWNLRTPDGYGIVAAKRCIEKYREEIYQDTQQEYSDHCRYCVEVLDEVLNKLECFMPSGGRPQGGTGHGETGPDFM